MWFERLALAAVLLNAVAYTGSALSLKAALARGVNAWQVSFWVNAGMAVLYLPFWLGADFDALRDHWFQPLLVAGIFFLGQLFTFTSLQFGDVSVATPLLGAKVVFVPLVAAGLSLDPVAPKWWFAAALSAAGVVVVTRAVPRRLVTVGATATVTATTEPDVAVGDGGGAGDLGHRHHHTGGNTLLTVACSLLAAASFAFTDVLFQHWSRPVGVAGFIAGTYAALGVLNAAVYLPLCGRVLFILPVSRAGRRALGLGCLLQAGQNLSMSLVLRFYGHATAVNVVYASRCLWSVVLAWLVARWVGGAEARLPREVLWVRLGGAALLFAAICLVVAPV